MRLWLFYDLFVRISSNALLTAKFVLFPTKQRYDFRVSTDWFQIFSTNNTNAARGSRTERERERERKDRLREREQKLAHERRYIKR